MIKRTLCYMLLIVFWLAAATVGGEESSGDVREKLLKWRTGVWISGQGTYTVYTENHYFVLSYEGDTATPNIYFGSSQVEFTEKGIARSQVVRYRQPPGGDLTAFRENVFQDDHTEKPLVVDTSLFTPGTCNIKDGVIYDSITEVTDEYVLLATCNGDKIKLFANGVAAYLPAGGGEFLSYRVEQF